MTFAHRPLLRVTDKLLAIDLLTDKDLDQLLCLIDPANFDNGYSSGTRPPCDWHSCNCENCENAQKSCKHY